MSSNLPVEAFDFGEVRDFVAPGVSRRDPWQNARNMTLRIKGMRDREKQLLPGNSESRREGIHWRMRANRWSNGIVNIEVSVCSK